MFAFLTLFVVVCTSIATDIPTVTLQNAAVEGLKMPAIRLGTFGYAPMGCAPENWNDEVGYNASLAWWATGARGWDGAWSYKSKQGIANAILELTDHYKSTPRSDIWITQKVGGAGCSLGYDTVMQQYESLLEMFETDYFDLLLIHWPSCHSKEGLSSDPICNPQSGNKYDPKECRERTWGALMDAFNNGSAKAIGVSNFETRHLQDIIAMDSLLPAVNQFEFHGYWHEFPLVQFCQETDILVNSYAPLGTPDVECDQFNGWPTVLTENTVAKTIGNKYKKSAAQTWLRWAWQQGIVVNPRTLDPEHMKENIDIFDFELTADDMQKLSSANSTAPTYPKNKVCPDPSQFP